MPAGHKVPRDAEGAKGRTNDAITRDAARLELLRLSHLQQEIDCISCGFANWGQHFGTLNPGPRLHFSPQGRCEERILKDPLRGRGAGLSFPSCPRRHPAPRVSVMVGCVLGHALLPRGLAASWMRMGLPGRFRAVSQTCPRRAPQGRRPSGVVYGNALLSGRRH